MSMFHGEKNKNIVVVRPLDQEGGETRHGQFYLSVRRFCRNRMAVVALIFIILLILSAIFADKLTPYDYAEQDLRSKCLGVSKEHLMGTDAYGRDVFTRILMGGRVSLLVSLMTVGLSTLIGLTLGAAAGYFGGKVDDVIMRITDVFLSVPGMIFALTVAAALGTGLVNTALALALTSWAPMVRQLRGSIILLKDQEFIEASKAFGAHDAFIIWKHVLPNTLAPLIVQVSMRMGDTITAIAGLSFLGLGVQPPTPEWGNMLAEAQGLITKYPMQIFWPGLMITLTMLSFNLLGDGLRDAMDPHMKR